MLVIGPTARRIAAGCCNYILTRMEKEGLTFEACLKEAQRLGYAEANPSFDVDGACEAFFEWKEHKKEDIMAFRNHAYRSVITGTMAPVHHTPWKDALEDSMESYLKN